jgi:hydrogenase expression/formation protein HypC
MNLERYGSCTLEQDGCSLCGDTAAPVRVLGRSGSNALVEDRLGQRAEVAVDFLPDAGPGDIVLVHMGVAIAKAETAKMEST